MISDPIPRIADAAYLTEVLRRSGTIGLTRVANVAVMSSLKKLRSYTFRLRLDYEGSTDDAPDFVVLKMAHEDDAGRPAYANAFYHGVAPAVPIELAPRCFEVVEATDTSAWPVLLEDLTDSHFIANV